MTRCYVRAHFRRRMLFGNNAFPDWGSSGWTLRLEGTWTISRTRLCVLPGSLYDWPSQAMLPQLRRLRNRVFITADITPIRGFQTNWLTGDIEGGWPMP